MCLRLLIDETSLSSVHAGMHRFCSL